MIESPTHEICTIFGPGGGSSTIGSGGSVGVLLVEELRAEAAGFVTGFEGVAEVLLDGEG